MPVTLDQVLNFIAANEGVVLKDWAKNPTFTPLCRAVFHADTRRRPLLGLRSPFIKKAFNEFYPDVDVELDMGNALCVNMQDKRLFLVLESNLELPSGRLQYGGCRLEYPAYGVARKQAVKTTFLGKPGIFVQQGTS